MASPTWWTWVWASSGSWWWTGKPTVLQYMGSQRIRHNWATKLNWMSKIIQYLSLSLWFISLRIILSRFTYVFTNGKSSSFTHACMISHFSPVWLFATQWTVGFQASLSMGFSRQEYCSGLPFPSPVDLPNPRIWTWVSCLLHWQAGSLPLETARCFLWLNIIPLHIYLFVFFITGHLGCFHILSFVYSGTKNIGLHVNISLFLQWALYFYN